LPFSKNINTILFDLDGTLRHNIPSGGDVFSEYTKTLGLKISDEERARTARWEHFYWANSDELRTDMEIYNEENTDFWRNYARRRLMALGLGSARALELAPILNEYMHESYKPQSIVPEEVHSLLTKLKASEYRLAVVSNRDLPYNDELDKLELSQYFEFSLAGGEIGSFKPEPWIFHSALERLGSNAHESMYVGDNYFADVVGSRRAGLVPVLYDPRGIFPDAGCATITSFEQLISLLKSL
jgi:FMN hydrolase / 5-amino-6-(5-phospho-D-ribitylamino)uracil phosphatase